jgi:hypothetical protein
MASEVRVARQVAQVPSERAHRGALDGRLHERPQRERVVGGEEVDGRPHRGNAHEVPADEKLAGRDEAVAVAVDFTVESPAGSTRTRAPWPTASPRRRRTRSPRFPEGEPISRVTRTASACA